MTTLTGWPTPQDYNEAIQTPGSSFTDQDLRTAQPEMTRLGLPRPVTGNFASVYRLTKGKQDVAVRCFFRDVADARQRYAAISRHLEMKPLPYMVGFHHLHHGIRIRGQFFPILKMDWVEGRLLDRFLQESLKNPAAIRKLADKWKAMAACLVTSGIAHGDLQHGNVFIGPGGEIRLVDYDGMYIPSLHGMSSHELGHPNYQHPGRDDKLFGPSADNFSHWVIYTTLLALSDQPGLWDELEAGDEKLLLGRADYENPGASPALRLMEAECSEDVRLAVRQLRHMAAGKVQDVPPLAFDTSEPAWKGSGRYGVASRRRRNQAGADSQILGGSGIAARNSIPDWISEELKRRHRRTLCPPSPWIRFGTLASACVACAPAFPLVRAGLGAQVSAGMVLAGFLTALFSMFTGYLLDPAGRARARLLGSRWGSRVRLTQSRWVVVGLSLRRRHRLAKLNRRIAAMRQRQSRCQAQSAKWRASIEADLQARLAVLETNLTEIDTLEMAEVSRHLEVLRQTRELAILRRRKLRKARIDGIPWTAKAGLWASGVRSAADVSAKNGEAIARLNPTSAAALLRWHGATLREARKAAPNKLEASASSRIERRYAKCRGRITGFRDQVVSEAEGILDRLASASDAEMGRKENDIGRLVAAFNVRLEHLDGLTGRRLFLMAALRRELEELEDRIRDFEEVGLIRYALLVAKIRK